MTAPVQISTALMPGVASLPHGWGHDLPGVQLRLAAERPGANLNALLDDRLLDPLSGNAVLSGLAVEVAPAVGPGRWAMGLARGPGNALTRASGYDAAPPTVPAP